MFVVPLSFAGNTGPSQAQFESQANAGLNCQLEYVDSTTVKFSSKSGATISVITPDLKTIDVTTTGLTKTVSGSTVTLYYVYLDSTGLSFSTSGTDTSYDKMKTLSGTKILVGYMGCSATNTIAGTHNIFSFWNESQRTYTQSTTALPSTITLNGFVMAPSKTSTVTWSGSIQGQTTAYGSYQYSCGLGCCYSGSSTSTATNTATGNATGNYASSISGYDECDMFTCQSYSTWVTRSQSVSLSATSITNQISNVSISLTGSHSYSCGPNGNVCGISYHAFNSFSGTITITRPAG